MCGSGLAALHLSVAFIQVNDASQACQHLKPGMLSQQPFSSDLLSLLVIRQLLYHLKSHHYSSESMQRRAAGHADWAYITNVIVCYEAVVLIERSISKTTLMVKTKLLRDGR